MTLSRRTFCSTSAVALAGLTLGSTLRAERRSKRVLLIAGPASHAYGQHDHPASCRFLAQSLRRVAGLEAETVVGWPEEDDSLEDLDALLVYSDGGGGHPLNGHFDEVERLVAAGTGLGILHYALTVDGEQPQRSLRKWIGASYELHWSVNPIWTARIEELPEHPITRGVKPFVIDDEWYYHMRFRPGMERVTPLLSTLPPASSLKRPDGPHSGNPHVRKAVLEDEIPQHLAWCSEDEEDRRGFGFTGLHWHWNLAHDGFRTFLLNAACWLAGVEIPPQGIPSARPDLAQLCELCGPPPEGWKRADAAARIAAWKQE